MEDILMSRAGSAGETSLTGIEIMTRNSIYSLRAGSVASLSPLQTQEDDKHWKLTSLRKRFNRKGLEKVYGKYRQRIMHVNLKAYLLLQLLISGAFIIVILGLNTADELKIIPEIVGHSSLGLVCCAIYLIVRREGILKKFPHIHLFSSLLIAFLLVAADLVITTWVVVSDPSYSDSVFPINGTFRNETQVQVHVPGAFYTILVIYNFLPLPETWTVCVIGFSTALIHLAGSAFLVYVPSNYDVVVRIVADGVYYLVANIIGVYARLLSEITLRRAFLDRRSCIESTFKLDYEKEQEENLMLSILPKHIASQVKEDIRAAYNLMKGQQQAVPKGPFSKLYVEKHKNVSVLYADIVNFTPLTVKLKVGELVEMLNELFGKFDDAAEKTKCLRIKILGDCYYCVSGIPKMTPEHAHNCVQMGFEMIDIIRNVREERRVDVDMRIGIHSGNVISGLLGIQKWQFDIWSRDVTIANHMEQSGRPGRIHISRQTRENLGNSYLYEPGYGEVRDQYLSMQGIETFLIIPPPKAAPPAIRIHESSQESESQIKNQESELQNQAENKPLSNGHTHQMEEKNSSSTEETSTKPTIEVDEEPDGRRTSTEDDVPDENDISSFYVEMPDLLPLPVKTVKGSSPVNGTLMYGNSSTAGQQFAPAFQSRGRRASLAAGAYEDGGRSKNRTEIRRASVAFGPVRQVVAGNLARAGRRSTVGSESGLRRKPMLLMASSVASYNRMMRSADEHMEKAIEEMPLSKFRHKRGVEGVNFFLFFSNPSWELPFLKQSDPLFKLYSFGALGVFLGIAILRLIMLPRVIEMLWPVFGVTLGVVSLSLPFLWADSIRVAIRNRYDDWESELPEEHPFIDRICWISKQLERKLHPRIGIFLVVTALVAFSAVVDIALCSDDEDSAQQGTCLYSWYFTFSCALALCGGFVFYRVHFLIKLLLYIIAFVVYSVIIFVINKNTFQGNAYDPYTGSPGLGPQLSHLLYLLSIVLVLHAADRQIEFIHRLDYIWQRRLANEQEEANTTRLVNKMLLLNILPAHVAEIYLGNSHNDDLYHEEYQAVAVMFASIPNYTDFYSENDMNDEGIKCLQLLNEIIRDFDTLLFAPQFSRIEKIKIVGSTYMAACGLASGRKGSSESEDAEPYEPGRNVVTMVRFAAAMAEVLAQLNKDSFQDFQLRIGIDCGPCIAGVVGAHKPLYDIWGDTVNMASRMDYTGQPGKIQVPEKTARSLMAQGIHCELRGETYVKGKGLVITYWAYPDQFTDPRRPSVLSTRLSSSTGSSSSGSFSLGHHVPPAVPEESDVPPENLQANGVSSHQQQQHGAGYNRKRKHGVITFNKPVLERSSSHLERLDETVETELEEESTDL